MATGVGAQIGLSGAAEFNSAMKLAAQQAKTVKEQMSAMVAQFSAADKSADSLTSKNKALAGALENAKSRASLLQNEIKTQIAKMNELAQGVDKATKEFGENSKEAAAAQSAYSKQQLAVERLKTQYAQAQGDVNKFTREIAENESAIQDAQSGYKNAEQNVDSLGNAVESSGGKFDKFGSVVKGVIVGVASFAAAAGAAAIKLGKEVIGAYADYEQLVGGVDTLFKESSATLQAYAANAYKTAGMSANEYMETVTGFSASLIQSLGGDTEKAVKYADMAMTDMSDNANKMGTDMEAIQNAYQGFAKQNYTMLDNLKLGYGGTKTEMERLLKDASAIAGVKFNIDSYADVVSAIHVMQDSMGIAGTTAKEAEETISGSINSMKGALTNLVVGFGDVNADVKSLTKNLIDSFKTVVKNITPVLENIVSALPEAIGAFLPAIGSLLPMLLQAATDLFRQVLQTILGLLPELIPVAIDALLTIVQALVDNLPMIINAALQLVTSLVQGITQALPSLLPAAAAAIVEIATGLAANVGELITVALDLMLALATGLVDAIPVLINSLPTIITNLLNGILENLPKIIKTGIELIVALAKGLIQAVPQLVSQLPKIWSAIFNAFKSVDWGEIGSGIVSGLWNGIKNMASWLMGKVKEWCGSILDGIKGFFGIHSPSRVLRDEVGKMIPPGIPLGVDLTMPKAIADMKNSFSAMVPAIEDSIPVPLDPQSKQKSPTPTPQVVYQPVFHFSGVAPEDRSLWEEFANFVNERIGSETDRKAVADGI